MVNQVSGAGSIKKLAGILKKELPRKIFVVSGKKSYDSSGARQGLESQLEDFDFDRYSDFSENPEFEDLIKGTEIINSYNPDLIIAIGGGSVIDTAKILSILPTNIQEAKKIIRGEKSVNEKIAPIVAIPTTSGSGSEATHFAVAYLGKVKYSVANDLLLPDFVILDPELTYSMPAYQTAVSGIDALSQGIESYWARGANEQSRVYASKAIKMILYSLEKAVNNPDPKVRCDMIIGANLAGQAINISKTTAPHALSYAFTTYYGVPHGHAVALTLGEFLLLHASRASEKPRKNLSKTMQDLFELMQCYDAETCRDKFVHIMGNIGLQSELNKIITGNINPSIIVDNVNFERLSNHPIPLSKKDITKVINAIL